MAIETFEGLPIVDTGGRALISALEAKKISFPNGGADFGNSGDQLRSLGDGGVEWASPGMPTYEQTEQAISAWLNAHPEATTTVADGAITDAKLNDALRRGLVRGFETVTNQNTGMKYSDNFVAGMICHTNGFHVSGDGGSAWYEISDSLPAGVNEANEMDVIECGDLFATLIHGKEINVKQFGAKGDENTDDHDVLQYCFTLASDNDYTVIIPCGYIFATTQPLSIPKNANLLMYSYIKYTGTETALTIGQSGVRYQKRRRFRIMLTSGKTSGIMPNSIGLHMINVSDSNIELESVIGFETNVLLHGDNAPFGYNRIQLNEIEYGKTQLHLLAGNAGENNNGWVNENIFYGGRFATSSDNDFYRLWTGIKIQGTLPTRKPNQNIFIKPSIEGALYAVDIAIANTNKFYNIRTEGCVNALNTDNDSFYNYLECGYGASNEVSNYNAANFVKSETNASFENYNETIYDSGFIPEYSASNDNYCTLGKTLFYVDSGTNLYATPYKVVKYNNGIEVGNRNVSFQVDCAIQKKFMVHPTCLNNRTCGLFIILLDANGNILNDENSIVGVGSATFTKSTATIPNATCFVAVGTTRPDPWVFEVNNNNAVKAIIGVRGFYVDSANPENNGRLQRILVKCPYVPIQPTVEGNKIKDGLTLIPTCEALAGDTCKNSTGANNGWRYNGNGWVTV